MEVSETNWMDVLLLDLKNRINTMVKFLMIMLFKMIFLKMVKKIFKMSQMVALENDTW